MRGGSILAGTSKRSNEQNKVALRKIEYILVFNVNDWLGFNFSRMVVVTGGLMQTTKTSTTQS